MTDLENESTSIFKYFKSKVYLNNVKTRSLNLTDNTRYVHRTHKALGAVWGNNFFISWEEPKHKNALY
jgi:hypothetical protein